MRWLKLTVIGLLLGLAAGAAATELWPRPREEVGTPLYFALEVRQAGRVVARPQLVGESGHDVRLSLRRRDGGERLKLALHPTLRGPKMGVELKLDLPDAPGLGRRVSLVHGEEAKLHLGDDVDVRMLAMRVRSPEFEAFIANAPPVEESPTF